MKRFGCTPLIERLENTAVSESGKPLFGFKGFTVRDPVDLRKVLLSFDIAVPCTFDSRKSAENALFLLALDRLRGSPPASPPHQHHVRPSNHHSEAGVPPPTSHHQPLPPPPHRLPPSSIPPLPHSSSSAPAFHHHHHQEHFAPHFPFTKQLKVVPLSLEPPIRLHIANLHPDISLLDLQHLLASFSPTSVTLGRIVTRQAPTDEATDPNGLYDVNTQSNVSANSRQATAVFDSLERAQLALQLINHLPVGGRRLRVAVSHPLVDPTFGQLAVDHNGEVVDTTDTAALRKPRLNDLGDERGGTKMTNEGRLALMEKLRACHEDRSADGQGPTLVATKYAPATGLPGVISTLCATVLSRTVLLKNLFDSSLTDADTIEEIREDVETECRQYGAIERVFLAPGSNGCILVKFETLIGAQAAIKALDKDHFDGREISAAFFPDSLENAFKAGALSSH